MDSSRLNKRLNPAVPASAWFNTGPAFNQVKRIIYRPMGREMTGKSRKKPEAFISNSHGRTDEDRGHRSGQCAEANIQYPGPYT